MSRFAIVLLGACGGRTDLGGHFVQVQADGGGIPSGPPLHVFVLEAEVTADFGGLAGADALCQKEASAAGLPGTYAAWLSDDHQSPSTRFMQGTGPYVRVDGQAIATNWDSLVGGVGNLLVPLDVMANGLEISGYAWTATTSAGVRNLATYSCLNWSAQPDTEFTIVGELQPSGEQNGAWTSATSQDCAGSANHLYCFQQSS
jgi:hypothetical protein